MGEQERLETLSKFTAYAARAGITDDAIKCETSLTRSRNPSAKAYAHALTSSLPSLNSERNWASSSRRSKPRRSAPPAQPRPLQTSLSPPLRALPPFGTPRTQPPKEGRRSQHMPTNGRQH
jgi:hypothetical protein